MPASIPLPSDDELTVEHREMLAKVLQEPPKPPARARDHSKHVQRRQSPGSAHPREQRSGG